MNHFASPEFWFHYLSFPYREYMKLMHWLSEHDWETWDEEIEKDSAAGKLDFLINEALEKKQQECLVKFNAQNHRAILGLLLCLARTSAETRAKEL